jgi:4'-phosphopantetheinyl transferase EntD
VGLLIKKYVDEDVLLGLWNITETYEELLNSLNFDGDDIKTLNTFNNYSRKLEWLSVRRLLKELTNNEIKIIYNNDRKPFLSDLSANISISHSKAYTSIIISKTKKVGIDLEYMSHRINKISSRFINENEFVTDSLFLRKYHLYIHWCAKETLYKICDKQNINFKKNITILPFQPRVKGKLEGIVKNESINETFILKYFRLNNYIIVWCSK